MILSYKVPPFPCHYMNEPGSRSSYKYRMDRNYRETTNKLPTLFALYGQFRLLTSDLNPLVYQTYIKSKGTRVIKVNKTIGQYAI